VQFVELHEQISGRYGAPNCTYHYATKSPRHVSFMQMCDCCIFRLLSHFPNIFPHKLAFLTSMLILFVFVLPLLPIYIRFCYLDHLVANSMAPCVQIPVEWDGVEGFKQFCTIFPHFSAAYLLFMQSSYFFKMPHKTDMPNLQDQVRGNELEKSNFSNLNLELCPKPIQLYV